MPVGVLSGVLIRRRCADLTDGKFMQNRAVAADV